MLQHSTVCDYNKPVISWVKPVFELPIPRRACAIKVEGMKTGHGVYLQGGGRTADCGEILLSDAVWESMRAL